MRPRETQPRPQVAVFAAIAGPSDVAPITTGRPDAVDHFQFAVIKVDVPVGPADRVDEARTSKHMDCKSVVTHRNCNTSGMCCRPAPGDNTSRERDDRFEPFE